MKSLSILVCLVFGIFACVLALPAHLNKNTAVEDSIALDPNGNYLVSWKVDEEIGTVKFNVTVVTTGFVGFGISNEGTMEGADIVAVEVNDDGSLELQVSLCGI
jgi:hypothetical protein